MKKFFPVYIRVPVIFFSVFGAMEYFVDSGDRPAFVKYPMVGIFLFLFLFLIIAIEIVKAAIDNVTYQMMTEEQKKKLEEVTSVDISITNQQWYKNLMKRLTKSEPVENLSLLLDHDYDGIKELDNKLPPWWLYLFYGCIFFGAAYLVKYELMGGDNPEAELRKEVAQAKIDVAKYMLTAPDMMSESKVTLLTDAPALAKGKSIYVNNCAACHRADGGGQIGPNLTDENWIFGGSIKNLFHTITNGGRDGKGMVAWKGTLKPTEIQQVASYILSLQGSNPKDAKAAEGEVWVDPAMSKKIAAK
ncbi:cbb3-type cytochrome c oxidase N-terminal domain-containing protein [Flavobacterium sp.]